MNQLFQLVEVTGEDAESFLQGQLAQDVRKLEGAGSLLAAMCNPKGRVFCTTRLLEAADGLGLVIPFELTDAVVKRLTMYRLRARVSIEVADSEWRCAAVATDDDLAALTGLHLLPGGLRNTCRHADGITAVDIGSPRRCIELYGRNSAFEHIGLTIRHPLTHREWQRALIDAGIPTIVPATSEKYTPHMLNLDRLGAVSFDKGCYTGQEIVARTEHLGKAKRRLMHYHVATGTAAVGDKVLHEQLEVGEVVNAVDDHLLAVLPIEHHTSTVTVRGHPASPIELPYG